MLMHLLRRSGKTDLNMAKISFYTAIFVIVINIQIEFNYAEVKHYSKLTKIKCQSRVDIGNFHNIRCAIVCMNYRAITGLPCMAYNVSNSVCTLCLNGPVSGTKQVIWSSTQEVYAATVVNFEEELKRG